MAGTLDGQRATHEPAGLAASLSRPQPPRENRHARQNLRLPGAGIAGLRGARGFVQRGRMRVRPRPALSRKVRHAAIAAAIGLALPPAWMPAAFGEADLPPRDKFELFVLGGQSNMDGVGGWAMPRHLAPVPGAFMSYRSMLLLGADKGARPMPEPFWSPFGAGREPGGRGIGPEWGFVKTLLHYEPDARIGIVKISASGSNIERWINDPALERGGGEYFANAVETVRRAARDGALKGFLWHQGESNSGSQDYGELFERMVAGYREAFGTPDLPVLAGTIGERSEPSARVNQGLAAAAARMRGVRVVASRRTLSDNVHYDADSQDEMGRLYACALMALRGAPPPLEVATESLPPGVAGTAYAWKFQARGGEGTLLEWSCDGLPPGLGLSGDCLRGALPDTPGAVRFAAKVRDAAGSAQRMLSLEVAPQPKDRIELLPADDLSVCAEYVLAGGRALYAAPEAPHSNKARACLRFQVPPAFRNARKAALRLRILAAGNRPPARLAVHALETTAWTAASAKIKEPATLPVAGAALGEGEAAAHDADWVLDLSGSFRACLKEDGSAGFEVRNLGGQPSGPVILASSLGAKPPVLILEN